MLTPQPKSPTIMTMTQLFADMTFEANTSESISPKTAHLVRQALQEALNEAAFGVLEKFDIPVEDIHVIHVDEIYTEYEEVHPIGVD